MIENNFLKDLKYDIFLTPKNESLDFEGSLEKISKLEIKRGISFFDLKILYKTEEFYQLRYYFKNKFYLKSYEFKEGDSVMKKSKLTVKKKEEVYELNSFMHKHLDCIIKDDYKLGEKSSISLIELKSDLKYVLRLIF